MGLKAYLLGTLMVVGCTISMAPRLGTAPEAGAAAAEAGSGGTESGGARPHIFASDSDPGGNGHGSFEISRGYGGHFYVEARVNGTRVRFVVDTGAYKVMLSPADARRIGLAKGDFSERGGGVGGVVRLMPVTLDKVELGPIRVGHVQAVVSEQPQDISLLGQNFLARLSSVEIRGDKMVLTN